MSRKRKPVEPPDDVPKWFMTYSDVITLLMTFFILLLTFATNEPERFEKMKISMFGGSGSTGIAGDQVDGLDRDSLVMRIRTDASRKAERGAEMPPVDKDASDNAMDKGLSGLEEEPDPLRMNMVKLSLPASHLASDNGEVFEYGEKVLDMFGKLSRQRTMDIQFETNSESNLPKITALADYLTREGGVEARHIVVRLNSSSTMSTKNIMVILQFIDGLAHAAEKTSAQ